MTQLADDWKQGLELLGRILERFSWHILAGMLGLVMFWMAWIPMAAPGDVSPFYRELTSGTILGATGIIEFFVYLEYHRP